MNTNHNIKKMLVGGLLSGGIALATLGLTAGTASAAPSPYPGPSIDHSDFGVPIVECVQCQHSTPGDGSVRVSNPGARVSGDGSVRVATPSAHMSGDGSVRVATPSAAH